MNSSAIKLNNAAVEAIHRGNLQGGFSILLQACADQNRMSKVENVENRKRGLPSQSSSVHASKNAEYDHTFDYVFEDCSNLALLPVACNDSLMATLVPLSHHQKLRLLNLKFLKVNPLLSDKHIDGACRSGVSWVLGYNLSILCAFVGLRIPDSRVHYLRKAMALLGPIHRTILKRRSNSSFWSTLKLSVLNNYALVLRECSMDTRRVITAMEILLTKTITAEKVDPTDADRFQRNLQSLQSRRYESMAHVAAAA